MALSNGERQSRYRARAREALAMRSTEAIKDSVRHLAFEAGLCVLVDDFDCGNAIGVAFRMPDGRLMGVRAPATDTVPAELIKSVQHILTARPLAEIERELEEARTLPLSERIARIKAGEAAA